MSGAYSQQAVAYAQAGWTCVLPVPDAEKFPPPTGFTGAEGRDTTFEDITSWSASLPEHSVALRMPTFHDPSTGSQWCVIGIDVDAYAKGDKVKHGDRTIAAKEAEWGALPPTWRSTARGSGPSGIRFYLAPVQRYATVLKAPQADQTVTGDVEIIQRHHRYAVVWPSPHAGAGDLYRWYDPSGQVVESPPSPHELPWLPQAWVQGLADGAAGASAASAPRAEGEALLDQIAGDFRVACVDVENARIRDVKLLEEAAESTRHDVMAERTHHVIQMAAAGHPGVGGVIMALRETWNQITAGEGREDEFERALLTSARKAVTVVGRVQVPNDPCALMTGGTILQVHAAAPSDERPPDPSRPVLAPVELDQQWNIRMWIGAHSFETKAGLDQKVAQAVLQRSVPAVRYAFDARAWLLRLTDRWEVRKELAPWLVSELAELIRDGDPEADKDSEDYARHQLRSRLMTNAGGRAVAGKIDSLVAAGTYPGSVALGDLDSDPEVLWAGGWPWSLRFSDVVPVVAEHIDPHTPHMHSCGVVPAVVPTPLWDAFLEAVWPDAGTRAWALRVLSIAFTGYADRALPVLLGETGRGKTQVVDLLMSVLGTYAHAANPKLLTNTGAHDTIRYSLKGRRLSFIDEAPAENRAGQEHLKQLTGGGEITANQMHKDPVTFRPTHTLVLTANDEPLLTDPAVRSRVRLIPCEGDPEAVRAARAAIGAVQSPAWRAEAPGVLASMMKEAAGWLSDPASGSMSAAPEHLMYLAELLGAEQDPITVWLEEETEPFEAGYPSRELYQAFRASCQRSGHRNDMIPTETRWGRELSRRGYPSMRTSQGKRRPLRIRSGDFIPGMPNPTPGIAVLPPLTSPEVPTSPQTPTAPTSSAQLGPESAQFVHGPIAYPAPTFSQVNPYVSDLSAQSAWSETTLIGTHTPAQAQEALTQTTRQPGIADPAATPVEEKPKRTPKPCTECGGTLGVRGVHDADCSVGIKQAAKNLETQTKRAEAARAKRIDAIAAATGAMVGLPALVTRNTSGLADVRPITEDQAHELLLTITNLGAPHHGHGELTVDVEHTGYPIGHRNYALRTIQLGDENLSVVLDAEDARHRQIAQTHLQHARELHAHSAAADIVPLAVAGLVDAESAWQRMTDTGTLAKIADPASTGNSDDLKGLAKALLPDPQAHAADKARSELFKAGKWKTDIEVTHDIADSGWAQVDHRTATMVRYDGSDVLDCAAIARRLPALAPDQLLRERTAQRMTSRVAHTGFRFVPEQIDLLHDQHTATKAALAAIIPVENPGSNDQLGALLTRMGAPLPPTGTGKPSVAKGVLEPLAGARNSDRTWAEEATSEVQHMARLILDWRHDDTALKLFLDPWRDMVRNGDGRARSIVHTLGADTGRMSSVRFNLQQISREGGMRACISADPGWKLITADFSSVEIRVAAALSQDQALIQMLLDGVDLHAEIAKLVWGPGYTKSNRYMAKRKVFGRIYGQSKTGMANTDGAGFEVADRVITAMDAMTPGLTAWSEDMKSAVEAGRTQYPSYAGRVIHLPKLAPHAAGNYAIQGSARELLIDALMKLDRTRWGGCVLMPVHDEILAMVPEDEADEATAVLKECMASELFGVPIVAEADEPSFEWKDSA